MSSVYFILMAVVATYKPKTKQAETVTKPEEASTSTAAVRFDLKHSSDGGDKKNRAGNSWM